jgi:hypothetical protein
MQQDSSITDWTCPNCSAEVQKGDKFCRGCGVQLDWTLSARTGAEASNVTIVSDDVDYSSSSASEGSGATSSEKEGSPAGTIFLFVVIALAVFLFLGAGSGNNENSSTAPSGTSQKASSEPEYYQERIAPHIVTGYAWNNFQISSGIQGSGSISDFSQELYNYLDGISPVSRSGIESSMEPGNGLSTLLYSIIDDEGTVDLIYTWLLENAPA